MAKKNQSGKNQSGQEIPIDKVEYFLNKNFKYILGVVGISILLVLIVYVGYKSVKQSRLAKLENLGMYEIAIYSKSADNKTLEEYLAQAENLKAHEDYAKLVVAQVYIALGNTQRGKEILSTVKGNLQEIADSLRYDIGDKDILSKYSKGAKFTMLWDYRRALETNDFKSFIEKYPNSNLKTLLESWQSL